jgi:glycosyltransferase involved in cell wall biosynthesis
MNAKISVIVPVYNVEKYLDKCVQSILNQTLNNMEIVLVDDGSTDKSGEIVNFYAEKDSRIKVIHQKNQGVSVARNQGLLVATGEYIAFIDPDDWIDNSMFEKLYCEAIQNDCDVVISCFFREDINNNKSIKIFHPFQSNKLLLKDDIRDDICSQLLMNGFFTAVWDKIYRRSFLEKYKIRMYHDVIFREDYFFNMDVFGFAERVKYLPIAFYHYRNTPNSASRKYYKNLFQFDVNLYNKKRQYSNQWFTNNEKYLNKVSYDFLMDAYNNAIRVYSKNNIDGIKNKWESIYKIVNCSDVRQAIQQYKYYNSKDSISNMKINLIRNKHIILLNLLSFFINNISVETNKNIKSIFKKK